MTYDLPPSSQKKPEDDDQGQRMTIYMPPGAVIVDRSEPETPTVVSATQIQAEEPQVSLKTGNEAVQSYGSVINIYTSSEARGIKEQSPSEVPAIENALVNEQQLKEQQLKEQQLKEQQLNEQQMREQQMREQQMREQQVNDQHSLLRISQMLDVISRRLDLDDQTKRLHHDIQPIDSVVRSAIPEKEIEKTPVIVRDDRKLDEKYVRIGFHFDWLHAFNIIYISLILFSIILPSGLRTFNNMEIFAASTTYEAAGIERGDLLIAEETPAASLVANDFVNLHNAFSGRSEMNQISEISALGDGGALTMVVAPQGGQAVGLSYTLDGDSKVNRVEKSVPNLGYLKMIFDSFFVQFLVAAIVIIVNIVVHSRRHRRYSKSLRRYVYQ